CQRLPRRDAATASATIRATSTRTPARLGRITKTWSPRTSRTGLRRWAETRAATSASAAWARSPPTSMPAIVTPFAIVSARSWSHTYAYAAAADTATASMVSETPPTIQTRRRTARSVLLPTCDGAQSPYTLAARAHPTRRLPLGARSARSGPRALPRRSHSGGDVPRRRRRPLRSVRRGRGPASAALGGAVRGRGLARGHRRRRARRRVRLARRRRAAVVAAPPFRARRLRRARRRHRRVGRSPAQ